MCVLPNPGARVAFSTQRRRTFCPCLDLTRVLGDDPKAKAWQHDPIILAPDTIDLSRLRMRQEDEQAKQWAAIHTQADSRLRRKHTTGRITDTPRPIHDCDGSTHKGHHLALIKLDDTFLVEGSVKGYKAQLLSANAHARARLVPFRHPDLAILRPKRTMSGRAKYGEQSSG